MPIDLAPHDLVLQDWGCPAVLRQASDVIQAGPAVEYEVTVIPQTVRLTPSETIASVQSDSRHFLIQSSTLPDLLNWLDCVLVVEDQIHRIISTEDSGTGGWVLLETHTLASRSSV